jgi:septal ring factor EnvC (AmiA/AmiB activator)
MAMLKWTMESIWAAVAVAATTAGGVYTTSYHWGAVNQQITTLQNNSSKHEDQLADIHQQNAAMKQSLDDIKDTVHDIQTQVRKH